MPIEPRAAGIAAAIATLCLLICSPVLGGEAVHVAPFSVWRFLPGTQEASSPDHAAWRAPGFHDADWAEGRAPFGYVPVAQQALYPIGTDLSKLDPPMRGNYSCVYLRTDFEISDPARVGDLLARIKYDDGCVVWLNGHEILRANVSGLSGSHVPFDALAAGHHSAASFVEFELTGATALLVPGRNVVAVQALNATLTSSDLVFDMELVDPTGADAMAPRVVLTVPAPGMTLPSLSWCEITFSEIVLGIDAEDLLVNGVPALAVAGEGAGPYTFTFNEPPSGPVTLVWASDHQIRDRAVPPHTFDGGSWTYLLEPGAAAPDVIINEFLASNREGLLDEDGEACDWIELHNRGTEPVNLAGWGLTDDPARPGLWTFPSMTIPAGGYLVVFASGKDRVPPLGSPHTSFKLSAAGEFLALSTWERPPRLVSVFDPQFPPQRRDYSYGRTSDGSWGYFATPTPGGPNGDAQVFAGFVADPVADPSRALVRGVAPLTVTLSSATPDARIYYTFDGTEPSENRGTAYTGPFEVRGTASKAGVVVRAVAYQDGWLPSNGVAWSYIFLDHVPSQPRSPTGFPTSWPNAPAADYEMDPEIVNSPRYTQVVRDALESIPTMSLVCNLNDLFGAQGIYANPLQSGVLWERPTSLELLFPDGREGFQVNCGLRIQGGASRNPNNSPKHSFRLVFRGDYGPTWLRFPLFEGSPVATFDQLVLRAGYNNSWIHWSGAQRARAQYIRDQWARDVQRAMGRPSAPGTYVHLYINGVYWGKYNLCERPNAGFAATHLGGSKEDYDALNSAEVKDGDLAAWQQMMQLAAANLSLEENYRALGEYLDIPGLADYMLLNFYGGNTDWPHHNWYAVRRRAPGAGYIFLSWDAEQFFVNSGENRTGADNANSPAYLFQRLRANAEFRLLFADQAHRHLFNGGVLTPAAAIAFWEARVPQVETSCVAESARWGDYRRDVHSWRDGPYELYTRDTHWAPERQRLLNQYFPGRTATVINQLVSANLYPRVAAPVFSRHGGVIEPGFALSMSRVGTGTIWFTTDGSDPREYGTGDVAPAARMYTAPVTLWDPTSVKARVREGAVWSALNEAMFRIPRPIDAVRVTEVMYHPAAGGSFAADDYEFLEFKNTGPEVLDLTGVRIGVAVDYTFPEGAILPPGGFAVVARNAAAFAQRYPGVHAVGAYRRNLSNRGDTIELRDADGLLVLSFTYQDVPPWPVEAGGSGFSLVPIDPDAAGDPNDPWNWRASAMPGGSPGADDLLPEPRAPLITAEPEDCAVHVGDIAVFGIEADGYPAPAYQWRRDGIDILGATDAVYVTFPAVREDHNAVFSCAVSNAAGAVVSRAAVLTVIASEVRFVRGDANADGMINIADAMHLLGILFSNVPSMCDAACDVNNDGLLNIADPLFLLGYLFAMGNEMAPPFPHCGAEDTPGELTCEQFAPCQ